MVTSLEIEMEKLNVRKVPEVGIEIAPGYLRTENGSVVRTPKSKLKKMGKRKEKDTPQAAELHEVNFSAVPEVKLEQLPRKTKDIQVTFKTAMGDVTGRYYPVLDCDRYVVAGLTEQSFIPKSYNETPDLRLEMRAPQLKATKVVFTGCLFTDPDSGRTYIVFMKV